uniref:Acetyl-CoA carboxylase n=1 Tax=Plectus sambesii TaxID=2011161 RepID=A0A914V1H7_9BILA
MYAALEALKKEKGVTQPCILAFTQTGSMGGKLCDMFVIFDAVPIAISDANVSVSVETLFASFFAFNLSYPPSLCGVYSLFEMLFGVMPSIKSTLAVADIYSCKISAA